MSEAVFSAFVTNLGKYNEGDLVGEWVPFPTSYEELQEVFARIGINEQYEEWFITDYDCAIGGLHDGLGEYESLDELNYLAARLDEMSEDERQKFEAAVSLGSSGDSLRDYINLTYSLDEYEFIPNVENDYDLGYYWLEESGAYNTEDFGFIAQYIDYEAYGRDIALNEQGAYTSDGYVYTTGASMAKYYDGSREDIPDEYRVTQEDYPEDFAENRVVVDAEKPSIAAMLAAGRQAPAQPYKPVQASEPEL